LQWIFGPHGNYNNYPEQNDMTQAYRNDAVLENARVTLMAGFTTVQSPGWPQDKPLNAAIAAGVVNGPRIITSLQRRRRHPGRHPGQRQQHKADGADFIKFFASGSIRQGGKMNVTQEQLDAVCGEAKAQGLRTMIHAHDPPSIIASVKAGCTQIDHGVFSDELRRRQGDEGRQLSTSIRSSASCCRTTSAS
jgi:imidazolonepropionase-like amidohydrolase